MNQAGKMHLKVVIVGGVAAGDCVESMDLVTGKSCCVPLGSTANKQGRGAAINICGGNDRFPN